MPRPRSLTEAGIARAALAVIDRVGVEGVSMRAVAGELGVGVMSLYRYVESREHLETLVVDLVLDDVDTAVPTDAVAWQEQVSVLMGRVRGAVGAHPSAVPLMLTHRHATPGSLRWIESMLGALAAGGFVGEDLAIAQRSLVSYLIGAVQLEHLGPLSGSGTAALTRLPADRYPHLAETASHARRISASEEFSRGLAIVIRGLDAIERSE